MRIQSFLLETRRQGYIFDRDKQEQGTEVKAVTYSAMQVYEGTHNRLGGCHVYVIVDI